MALPALIAALPREIAGLLRTVAPQVRAEPAQLRRGIALYRLPQAVVVAAGMGAARASLAVEAALQAAPITELVSIGLAGSCSAEWAVGQAVAVHEIVDVSTGERYDTQQALSPGGSQIVLATTPQIASVAEKLRLHRAYSAAIVDMEAATIARLARAHGLGLRAVKAISDAHDFELASLNQFVDDRGSFRTAAFALHTAVRPVMWSAAATLGRNSATALQALDTLLSPFLQSR